MTSQHQVGLVRRSGRINHGDVLSRRALNRALLARQMLLQRIKRPALDSIERLVGMQAQIPNSPYTGLWSRLDGFQHEELSDLIESREVVRIALMRSTIHTVSARDCLSLRTFVQPAITRMTNTTYGKFLNGIDLQELSNMARMLVESEPRSFQELGELLQLNWPDRDQRALSQTARALLPLIQVPPRGVWGKSGQATHTTVESWLGRSLDQESASEAIVMRYLAAFGPATIRDIQTWSGLTRLKQVVERLRPQLVTFRDELDNELFDISGGPLPDANVPAPPRFLADYDNAIIGFADRSRILDPKQRDRVLLKNGMVPTLLVDGFVAGTWRIDRSAVTAMLTIGLFGPIESHDMIAVEQEGTDLVAFLAGDAASREVQLTVRP
jgi:hypothetical protein